MEKILQQQLNKVGYKYSHSLHVFISLSEDMIYTPGICLLSSNERSVSVLSFTPQHLMFTISVMPLNIYEAIEVC